MAVAGVNDYTSTYGAAGSTSTKGSSGLSSAAKDYLNDLRQRYSDVNISVADFRNTKQMESFMMGCGGSNNIIISSNIIEQMAKDPAAAAKYEKVIADAPKAGKEIVEGCEAKGLKVLACGTRIDQNGKVTYWGVASKTGENPGTAYKEKIEELIEEIRAKKKEEKLKAKKAEEKKLTEQPIKVSLSKEGYAKLYDENSEQDAAYIKAAKDLEEYASQQDKARAVIEEWKEQVAKIKNGNKASDYYSYLSDNFDCVKNGDVAISGAYLKKCADDPKEAKKLEENLGLFKDLYKQGYESAKRNAERLGGKLVSYSESWSIDSKGNITMIGQTTVTSDTGTKSQKELEEELEERRKEKKEEAKKAEKAKARKAEEKEQLERLQNSGAAIREKVMGENSPLQ